MMDNHKIELSSDCPESNSLHEKGLRPIRTSGQDIPYREKKEEKGAYMSACTRIYARIGKPGHTRPSCPERNFHA
jgi:hypothetical protein